MCKKIKTNADRLKTIHKIAETDIGDVSYVDLKFKDGYYCCKLRMVDTDTQHFDYIQECDTDATVAVKKLKKRLKKISKRFNIV